MPDVNFPLFPADQMQQNSWQTYTPTLIADTTNPNLGASGIALGRYCRQADRLTTVSVTLRFAGAGVAAGSGIYSVTLPVAPRYENISDPDGLVTGFGWATDNSVSYQPLACAQAGPDPLTQPCVYLIAGSAGQVTNAVPWTWAAGDVIMLTAVYEAETYSRLVGNGPSSRWLLEDITSTAASSGVPGTYMGGYAQAQVGAIVGDPDVVYAVVFDGTGYITVPDDALLDLGDVFSLELWVQRENITTVFGDPPTFGTGVETLIDKGANGYKLYFENHLLKFSVSGGSVAAVVQDTIEDTEWHHVVVTQNAGTPLIYVDGVDNTNMGTVTAQTFADTAAPLIFAANNAANGEFFKGTLDELAVYPTVLTPNQVLAHYNAGVV